jgi:cytochrome c oxidase subunit 1
MGVGMGMGMAIFAIHLMGISSIMGAINIIVTGLNMRAPGMTLMKMPMSCRNWLITAYLLIAVMPVFGGAVTMILTDRHFGTTFFNAAGGGDPVMYQHIIWFFGRPEVYIMILPAFGILSQVIPPFSRKPLFGYASMVYATSVMPLFPSSSGCTTCSPPACRHPTSRGKRRKDWNGRCPVPLPSIPLNTRRSFDKGRAKGGAW